MVPYLGRVPPTSGGGGRGTCEQNYKQTGNKPSNTLRNYGNYTYLSNLLNIGQVMQYLRSNAIRFSSRTCVISRTSLITFIFLNSCGNLQSCELKNSKDRLKSIVNCQPTLLTWLPVTYEVFVFARISFIVTIDPPTSDSEWFFGLCTKYENEISERILSFQRICNLRNNMNENLSLETYNGSRFQIVISYIKIVSYERFSLKLIFHFECRL